MSTVTSIRHTVVLSCGHRFDCAATNSLPGLGETLRCADCAMGATPDQPRGKDGQDAGRRPDRRIMPIHGIDHSATPYVHTAQERIDFANTLSEGERLRLEALIRDGMSWLEAAVQVATEHDTGARRRSTDQG